MGIRKDDSGSAEPGKTLLSKAESFAAQRGVLKRGDAQRLQRLRRGGLRSGEVHIVSDLLLPEDEVTRLSLTLSSDERERADTFYFAQDRRRFMVCRGLLRSILGMYLEVKPRELRLANHVQGKPALNPDYHSEKLEFNVSRSEDRALLAVALDAPVGVDVEGMSSRVRIDPAPKNLFSTAQVKSYARLRRAEKNDFLLRCWTRKEALVKALGEGLARPLASFEVSARARVQILEIDGERRAEKWSIYHLRPAADFIGALAIRGEARALHSLQYEY